MKTPSFVRDLVSVVMPSYNRASRLTASIESCLAQTHKQVEVIVIDDGSTDNTQQVLQQLQAKWGGDKVRWMTQKNAGACSARNAGMDMAKGEFLQFLDSDDLLHPVKFEEQIKAIRNTGYPAAVCDFEFISEETGELIKRSTNEGDLHRKVASFKSMSVFTPLIHTASIPVGCRWNSCITRNQDMDFMFRYFMSISNWAYTPGYWSIYIFHNEERVSDLYKKGVQYDEMFFSAFSYWKSNRSSIPASNNWMIRELAITFALQLEEQGRKKEARKLARIAIGLPLNRKRLIASARMLTHLREIKSGIRSLVPSPVMKIKRTLFPYKPE